MSKRSLAAFTGVILLLVVVGCTGLLSKTQHSSSPSSDEFELAAGDAQMASEFPFQYVPVRDAPVHLIEMYKKEATRIAQEERGGPPAKLSPDRPVDGYLLAEFRGKAGPLLVPSYLPKGFSLEKAVVSQLADPRFEAAPPPVLILFGGPGMEYIQLHISLNNLAPREMWPLKVELKEGSFKPISSGTISGYLIQGTWGALIDSSSTSVEIKWMDNLVRLAFLRGDQLVEVVGTPASAFTEEELIRVAESLQPF